MHDAKREAHSTGPSTCAIATAPTKACLVGSSACGVSRERGTCNQDDRAVSQEHVPVLVAGNHGGGQHALRHNCVGKRGERRLVLPENLLRAAARMERG